MTAANALGGPARLLFVAANPSIDRLYEVDRLVAGEIHRPRSMVAVPGGKGLNAARAAQALGGSVTAVGIVAGRAGDWIVEALAERGVDARMARSIGETRTCVSILDRSSGALTEVYERGAEVGAAVWAELESIVSVELARGDIAVVALSGSLPPGAPTDGYARIARIAGSARAASGTARPAPVRADN
jgi:tagatose 6-phosphate kinase